MLDRRTFIATVATLPLLPHTREVMIGFGCLPSTRLPLHEEFAVEKWNGSGWERTRQRRTLIYDGRGNLLRDLRWNQCELAWLFEQES